MVGTSLLVLGLLSVLAFVATADKANVVKLKAYVDWEFKKHKIHGFSVPKSIQKGASVHKCIHQNMMAFTFDDGPNYSTQDMLAALDRNGVIGTFFILGKHIENRPRSFIDILRYNHSLGGHGWNHKGMPAQSVEMQSWSIEHEEDVISKITGGEIPYMYYWRTPGGATSSSTNKVIMSERNKYLVHWSMTDSFLRSGKPDRWDCLEGPACTNPCDKKYCDGVWNSYKGTFTKGGGRNKCPVPGAIILLHESRFTAALLDKMLGAIKENFPDCKLVGMEECLGQIKPWTPERVLANVDYESLHEDVVHFLFPPEFDMVYEEPAV